MKTEDMETRLKKWKKYRDSVNGGSFFYYSFLQSDENLKKKYLTLKEMIKKINLEKTMKLDEISVFENLDKENSLELEFDNIYNKLNILDETNFKISLENLYSEINDDFSFLDNLDISSHLFDDEIKELDNIKLNNKGDIMKKINIAIDGPSGVGKSTVSELIAKKFNLKFINSGSLYRAISLFFFQKLGKEQFKQILDEKYVLDNWNINQLFLDPFGNLFLDNVKIENKDLRKDEISWGASKIAKYKLIRSQIVSFLQDYSEKEKGVIMDGRDTTFVVLPNAELKIFLWASAEIRATRRMEQNQELGFKTNYEELLKEIEERDFQDMNRENDPLHKTDDAILIDSSNMNIQEVVNKISELILERINNE